MCFWVCVCMQPACMRCASWNRSSCFSRGEQAADSLQLKVENNKGKQLWVWVILQLPNQTETPSVHSHSGDPNWQRLRIIICSCFITVMHIWRHKKAWSVADFTCRLHQPRGWECYKRDKLSRNTPQLRIDTCRQSYAINTEKAWLLFFYFVKSASYICHSDVTEGTDEIMLHVISRRTCTNSISCYFYSAISGGILYFFPLH